MMCCHFHIFYIPLRDSMSFVAAPKKKTLQRTLNDRVYGDILIFYVYLAKVQTTSIVSVF